MVETVHKVSRFNKESLLPPKKKPLSRIQVVSTHPLAFGDKNTGATQTKGSTKSARLTSSALVTFINSMDLKLGTYNGRLADSTN